MQFEINGQCYNLERNNMKFQRKTFELKLRKCMKIYYRKSKGPNRQNKRELKEIRPKSRCGVN